MTAADDPLTATRLDVAEMKGMLTQALSDQGTRIANLEKDARLPLAHAEKIRGLEKAVNVLENDNRARRASIIGFGSLIIGAGGLALAVINRLTI